MRVSNLILGLMLAGLCTANLSASPIFGTFNIDASITVTPTTITWISDTAVPDKALIGSTGLTGSFVGLGGTNVTIHDLNSTIEPVNAPFPPPGQQPFISFDAAPSLGVLNISFIFPGVFGPGNCLTLPAAAGQTCTLAGSPFSFVNTSASTSSASFVFTGVTADHLSTWRGVFTSQFLTPYQSVVAAFATGTGGSVTNTFSASFDVTPLPTVPEPSPMILTACGLGLVALSSIRRWRLGRRGN